MAVGPETPSRMEYAECIIRPFRIPVREGKDLAVGPETPSRMGYTERSINNI